MLPSAGYFKGFNCPFYDSGLCERPYCHFRHVKNDSLILQNDEFESGAILQKLVSAAVQKVLEQTEKSAAASYSQPLVSECISDTPQVIAPAPVQSTSKAKYNPTPISELKKIIDEADEQSKREEEAAQLRRKHIPVPYTPRKPPSLPINRPADIDESGAELFTYLPPPTKYTPGCGEISAPDPYLPEGTKIFPDPYLQGNKDEHEHAPIQTQLSDKPNYVPSDKKSARKKRLEYNPTKVTHNHGSSAVKYQPTPKSLVPVFSSDEEEPEIKKTKISNDLGNFDDLGPEFDMLDEILEEENGDEKSVSKINSDQMLESKNESQPIENHKDSKKNKKSSSEHKEQRPISNVKKKHKTDETSSHGSKEKNNESKSNRDRSKEKTKDKHDKKEDRSTSKDKSEKHVKKSNHSSNKDKTEKHDNKDNRRSSKDKSEKNYNKNDHSSSKDKSEKHDKKDDHISSRDKSEKIKQKDSNKKDSNNSHSSDSSSKNSKSNTKNHEKHSSSSNQSKPSSSKDSSQHKHTSKHKSKHREDKKKSKEKHEKDAKRARSNSTHSLNDFDDTELADDELVISSESDEESRAIECKRIFEEYIPMAKPTTVPTVENVANHSETVEYVPGKIRISRTSDKNIKVQPRPAIKPDFKLNAAQTMNDRLAKVREYHIKKTDNHHTSDTNNATIFASQSESVKNTPSSYTNNSSSKIRIAHVPYASTLVNAKKLYTPTQALKKDVPSTSTTIVQTVKKGEQRTAHIPNEKFIDRPGVLEPLASKIPANIRSIYLNMMIDECLKIYILPADAYARAQHEELTTSKKCSKVQIYKNSAVLAVTRLRKELQECDGIKKSGSECSALQNIPRTGSNQTNNASSWSIESKNRGDKFSSKDFKGAQFYKNISKWILTEEQLLENGFPMAHPSREKGRAMISGEKRQKQKPPKGNIRTCCRCNQDYTVDKRGFPAVKQECIYHPNRKYRYRGEAKYQCCGQDGMSDGCCAAPCHVWEYVDYDNLKGFVTTLPSATEMSDYGVYALDCEMCYTTHGLDLTRITVIDSSCKVVYETLIKPLHPIIDYNTRYSGITEEQMADVKTTLLEVQASLLTMFNSKTILIGHSLESDFKALKLIHGTVIDTSVMFPHKMGPPFKRALRNLSSEYLKKIIQNSVEGHDSAEDATVCMELVIYKLKEDLKTS